MEGDNPFGVLHRTIDTIGRQAASNWQGLANQCKGNIQGTIVRVATGLQQLPAHAHRQLQRHQQQQQQLMCGGWAPALAVSVQRFRSCPSKDLGAADR